MSVAVCPYCRSPIEPGAADELLCPGCGTPHHSDCFQENGGCTVFGCSSAPADEQKVTLTGSDLGAKPAVDPYGNVPGMLSGVGLMPPGWKPNVPPPPLKAAPPPMPPGAVAPPATVPAQVSPPPANTLGIPRFGSGSVLFGATPMPVPAAATQGQAGEFDFTANPNAKNRTNFIVLGVLLGAFGAHNFYAGYNNKAIAQLLLTVLTLGFASPMSWVWAVIDVCTVDRDGNGIRFRS
jgi:TM2 domain-containing membrane protein YozV